MKLDPQTISVSGDDGADLGHAFDVLQNKPELRAQLKGLMDQAWLAREEQHRAQVRDLAAQIADLQSKLQGA